MKVDTGSGKYRIVAEINMVPFIDITLVLLIIFMVMTPFLIRSQIKVNLPTVTQAQSENEDKESVTVQVERNGDILIEGDRVTPDKVATELSRRMPRPQTQSLYVEADRDVSFQHVVVVLDAGKQHGVTKLGIRVKPEKTSSGSSRRR